MAKLSPITTDDEWFQGETKLLRFGIETEDEDGTREVINGWSVRWQLMQNKKSQDTILEKATGGSGIVITNGANGELEVTIAPSDTTDIEPRTYWHELWRTDTNFETVLSYGPAALL